MSEDQKNEKKNKSVVTLIEDPFGLNTLEISDAQNTSDELDLDSDLLAGENEENSASEQSTGNITEDLAREAEELEEAATELDEEVLELADETSEQLHDQLDKLAQAIGRQTEADLETMVLATGITPDEELALQIAEDQALQREIAREQDEAHTGEAEAPPETTAQVETTAHGEAAGPSETETRLNGEEIQSCIEALLFLSDKPMSLNRLRELLGPDYDLNLFEEALTSMKERYQSIHHGIELVEVAGGFQFRTKPGRAALAQKLAKVQTQRLSSGGMESLAIIAYKQPIMKEEIDKIRGVDSSYFVRGLLDKKLIKISGRSELPGRPILYSTTEEFLQLFGLKDLSSLPSLRELEQMVPTSSSNHEEDPRLRDMRRLVSEMKADKSSALHYNPKEDEKILKEIRERVTSIPSSTPYLDEIKAAELLAKQQLLNPQPPQSAETSEQSTGQEAD